MRSLLLVAHGSRREASNAEVLALTSRLKAVARGFSDVRCAFLELTGPTMAEAVDATVEAGAREVVVLPYFLAAGSHVARDIPEIIAERRAAHPQVSFNVLPHLGATPALDAVLLAMAGSAEG